MHGLVKEGALAVLLRSVKWAGAGRTPRVDPALGLQSRSSGSDVTDRATRLFTRDGVGRPGSPKGMQVGARSRMLDEDLHSRSTHRDASGHEGNREDRGQVRPREPGHRLTHSEPEPCQFRTSCSFVAQDGGHPCERMRSLFNPRIRCAKPPPCESRAME